MKNIENRWLPITCNLIMLSTAPLLATAQSPTAPAAAPPAATAPGAAASGTPPSPPTTPPRPEPATPDEAAHTIGTGLGSQLRQIGITNEISIDRIVEGIKDGLAGQKPAPQDQQKLQAYMRSVSEATAAKNAAAAKAFLEKNGKEKGVVTTASGLQYKILEAGDKKAASPQPTDQVTVQYRGTLLDGSEFDSSYKRGQPAQFRVNGVVKGWQEALALMKPGAKWKLFIPPELGYGQAPRPGIPGGSLLTFEIELQTVKPAPAPQPASSPVPPRPSATSPSTPASPPASPPPAPPTNPSTPN